MKSVLLLSPSLSSSMQREKRFLPTEGACHITMEVRTVFRKLHKAGVHNSEAAHWAEHLHLDGTSRKQVCTEMAWQHGYFSQHALQSRWASLAVNEHLFWDSSSFTSRICFRNSDERLWLGHLLISAVTKCNVSTGGLWNNSGGPIRANRNGCLIYIAIRLAVFIHHFRLFITPVKNSMQWISCDIKSQFFLKAGTGSKLKDC